MKPFNVVEVGRDRVGSIGRGVERLLPALVFVFLLVLAYFLFIQPRITDYLRASTDRVPLETRVSTTQGVLARGASQAQAPDPEIMRLFRTRMAADDKTAEIVEQFARFVLASGPSNRVTGLDIEAGDRVRIDVTTAGAPRAVSNAQDFSDPRFELFQTPLQYTPITITFNSTYETIGRFVWELRDLPTIVEVRSIELTRGQPLMKAKIVVFVYQRLASPNSARDSRIRAELPTTTGASGGGPGA